MQKSQRVRDAAGADGSRQGREIVQRRRGAAAQVEGRRKSCEGCSECRRRKGAADSDREGAVTLYGEREAVGRESRSVCRGHRGAQRRGRGSGSAVDRLRQRTVLLGAASSNGRCCCAVGAQNALAEMTRVCVGGREKRDAGGVAKAARSIGCGSWRSWEVREARVGCEAKTATGCPRCRSVDPKPMRGSPK
jgi:hypothetical protein